jgi:hypothetical protein
MPGLGLGLVCVKSLVCLGFNGKKPTADSLHSRVSKKMATETLCVMVAVVFKVDTNFQALTKFE